MREPRLDAGSLPELRKAEAEEAVQSDLSPFWAQPAKNLLRGQKQKRLAPQPSQSLLKCQQAIPLRQIRAVRLASARRGNVRQCSLAIAHACISGARWHSRASDSWQKSGGQCLLQTLCAKPICIKIVDPEPCKELRRRVHPVLVGSIP